MKLTAKSHWMIKFNEKLTLLLGKMLLPWQPGELEAFIVHIWKHSTSTYQIYKHLCSYINILTFDPQSSICWQFVNVFKFVWHNTSKSIHHKNW